MKKILLFAVMFGVLFGMGGVLADSQTVGGDVPGFVDFTLLTTILNFGSVVPGTDSATLPNQIQVNAANNVPFTLTITLTSDPSTLFSNIFLDLNEDLTPETQLSVPLVTPSIPDPAGSSTAIHDFKALLRVPNGFGPVTGATGTVTYTITGP